MAIAEAGKRELFAKLATENMGITIDETIGGLALIVLAILALDGIDPPLLSAIATVVAGVALMFMGATLSSDLTNALSSSGRHLESSELTSGLSAGVLGGVAGIVLGILAILDVARPTLVAVALIVFGAAVLFDLVAMAQARALKMMARENAEQSSQLALSVATSTNTGPVLAGVGLITLGILALTGLSSEILVSVALLGLGVYLFMEGTAVVNYMLSWRTS
jgi:hypothetical protein